jgi:hypothetical protein
MNRITPIETAYIVASLRLMLDNHGSLKDHDREIITSVMLRLAGTLDLDHDIKLELDR